MQTKNVQLTKSQFHLRIIHFFLLGTEVPVGHVRQNDENGEEQESQDGLPQFHIVGRLNHEDDNEPHVGEDAEEGCDGEHFDVVDPPHAGALHRKDAHARDDQQVEGRRADDGARTQLSGHELVPNYLNTGQEDLGGTGAESHESQIGYCIIPHFHLHLHVPFVSFTAGHLDFPRFAGDFFNSTHEHISNDSYSKEAPEKAEQVQGGPEPNWPCVLVYDGQNEPLVRAFVRAHVARGVWRHGGSGGGGNSGIQTQGWRL